MIEASMLLDCAACLTEEFILHLESAVIEHDLPGTGGLTADQLVDRQTGPSKLLGLGQTAH